MTALAVRSSAWPHSDPTGKQTQSQPSRHGEGQQDEETLGSPSTWTPIIIFTLALAVVGTFQAGLFWWQLDLIRQGSLDTAKAADAAERAANAAKDSVLHAQETAKRQLRAYVLEDSGDLQPGPNGVPMADVRIKNFGATPAYEVKAALGMMVASYPLSKSLTVGDLHNQGHRPLGPGAKIAIKGEWTFEKAVLVRQADVGSRQHTIFVYGEITYRDIFGDYHATRFRLYHGGMERPAAANALYPDTEGNEAT